MSKLNDYSYEDQLYVIENFITHCNKLDEKITKDPEKPTPSDTLLLNYLVNN